MPDKKKELKIKVSPETEKISKLRDELVKKGAKMFREAKDKLAKRKLTDLKKVK